MFLLDTNAVSDLRRPHRASQGLVDWAGAVKPTDLFVSAITLFELELGVALAERRNPEQGERLRAWLDGQVLPEFQQRILAVDAAVARRCAALHAPTPRPYRDSLIGATALVHGMTVITRNIRDFEPMGVPVLNPWNSG